MRNNFQRRRYYKYSILTLLLGSASQQILKLVPSPDKSGGSTGTGYTVVKQPNNPDTAITNMMKATEPDAIFPAPDKRGRHAPKNKLDTATSTAVKQHIESFHPQVSHYGHAHAPLRRYLPSDITITEMHTYFLTSIQTRNAAIRLTEKQPWRAT